MLAAVVLIVAEAPLSSSGWTLLTRFVQIVPPRRLGRGMKFLARASSGARTALSFMNSRSIVLRAASRVMLLLTVTRTVWPGLRSIAMLKSPGKIERGSIATDFLRARAPSGPAGGTGCRSGGWTDTQLPDAITALESRDAGAGLEDDLLVQHPAVDHAALAGDVVGDGEVGGVHGVRLAGEDGERRGALCGVGTVRGAGDADDVGLGKSQLDRRLRPRRGRTRGEGRVCGTVHPAERADDVRLVRRRAEPLSGRKIHRHEALLARRSLSLVKKRERAGPGLKSVVDVPHLRDVVPVRRRRTLYRRGPVRHGRLADVDPRIGVAPAHEGRAALRVLGVDHLIGGRGVRHALLLEREHRRLRLADLALVLPAFPLPLHELRPLRAGQGQPAEHGGVQQREQEERAEPAHGDNGRRAVVLERSFRRVFPHGVIDSIPRDAVARTTNTSAHRGTASTGEHCLIAKHATGRSIAPHLAVKRVALDGDAAGFADQSADVRLVQLLVGRAAAAFAFSNVVPDDGAVEIVAAPVERDLREADALHDPERLDVRDVVEHQPRDGEGLEVGQPGRAGEVSELAAFGDEAQGDDAVEAGTKARRHGGTKGGI